MFQFKRSLELDGKEDPSRMSLSVDPGTPAESHVRLLHKAASKGDLAGTKRALAAGAAVDSPSPEGQAALILAASKGHAAVLEYLLLKGAAVDLKSSDGKTALQICAAQGAQSSVEALLANKAEIDGKDSSFLAQTALHYAAANGHAPVVQLLLEKGAMVELDCFMGSALQLAAQNNHTAVVTLLLQKNAAMNKQDKQGRTALHMAADAGLVGIVDALVKSGANVSIRDAQSKTALQLAKMKQTDFRSRPFGSQFAAYTSIVTKLQQIRVPAHEAEEVMRASLDIKRSSGAQSHSRSHLKGLAGGTPIGMPSAAADATTPDPHTAAVQPALASSLYQLTVPKPASAVAAPDAISKAGVKAENKPQAEVDAKAQSESRAGQSAAVSDVPAARTGPGLGQTVWDQVKRHSNSADHAASTPARISGEGSHQATFSQAAASHQAVREQSSQNRTSGVQRKLGELDPATAAAAAKPSLPTAAVTEDGHSMLEGGSDSSTDKPNALSASQTAAVAGKALGAVEKADDSDNNNIESTTLTVKQMPSSQQSAAAANAFGLPDMTQAIFIPMASPHPLHAAHTGAMPYPPTSPGRSTAPATVSAVRGTASGVATRTGGPQTDHAAHAPHAFGQPDSTSSPRRASASAAMGASAGSRGQSAGLVGSPGGGVKPVGFFAGQMAAQQWAIPANHASANQASANHTLANHTPASHASAQPAATGRSSGGGSSPRKSLESLKAQLAKVQEHQTHIEQQLDGVKTHLLDLEQQEYFTETD